MKKQKIKETLWGIGLVAAAIFLVLNQLHLLSFQLGLSTIIWTIIFGITLVNSIAGKNTFGIVFSIAFLLIVYAEPLHITKIVPWTLLLAALLVYAGLSMIFSKRRHHSSSFYIDSKGVNFGHHDDHVADGDFTASGSSEDERHVVINQKLADISRYVHSQNLESVAINATMSEAAIYLDAAKPAGTTVTITVNVTMSEVTIYLPLSWKIDDQLSTAFGDVEINGSPQGDGPTVILQGSNKIGEITINYV